MAATPPPFTPETFAFLEELAANNNREWFESQRERYESHLLAPARAFVESVGEGLRQLAPAIHVDLRTNGSGNLMRIYRDTRFSADKSPYKTNVAALWWEGPGKKSASPAFGFQLTREGMGLMAGLFGFQRDQLARYRDAVADEVTGRSLAQIVATLAEAGYDVQGAHYKRVPSGYADDHPRADLLRHNGLYAHPQPGFSVNEALAPGLVERCLAHFARLAPLQRWLVDVLL